MENRENGMHRENNPYGYDKNVAGQMPSNPGNNHHHAGGAANKPVGAPRVPAPARMPKARALELAGTLKRSLIVVSLATFASFSGLAAYHQAHASGTVGPTNNPQTSASANANTTTANCSAPTNNNSNSFFKHEGDDHFHQEGGDDHYEHEGDEHGGDDDNGEHHAAPTATTNQSGCTTNTTSGPTGGPNTAPPSTPVSGTRVS